MGQDIFFSLEQASFFNPRAIWKQSLGLSILNSSHIYSNLRKRFPENLYLTSSTITFVKNNKISVDLVADLSHSSRFDMVIAADGLNSTIRKALFPDLIPNFRRDFVSWHGSIETESIINSKFFDDISPVYLFKKGHFLFYKVPAPDYETSKKILLSWSVYTQPTTSSIADLHQLARDMLPTPIADFICNTKSPSMQPIFDYIVPSFVVGNTCLLGQTGANVGPHAASPELRELTGALSLAQALDPKENSDLNTSLAEWNESQLKLAKGQKALSEKLGRGFVTTPPDWASMDSTSMGLWWQAQIDEKPWQTPAPKTVPWIKLISEEDDTWPSPLTPPSKQFMPSLNSKEKAGDMINNLCTEFESGLILEQSSKNPRTRGV